MYTVSLSPAWSIVYMEIWQKRSRCGRIRHFCVLGCFGSSKYRSRLCTIRFLYDGWGTFLSGLPFGVEERLHPAVVEAVWFHQVYYHEFVLYVFARVCHWKEVPLGVWLRVPIGPQNQLVLKFQYLNGPPEIACLELSLKNEGGVGFRSGEVKGQQIDCVVFGVKCSRRSRFLLVIDYLIEQRIHENDNLDILLDGLFQNMQFGLIDRVGFFVLRLYKLRIAGQQSVIDAPI